MPRKVKAKFKLEAPQAGSVTVAGTFNHWNITQTPMRRGKDGIWAVTVSLPAGLHEYRFVVDGQWVSDPNATRSIRNPHGVDNSVVLVEA